MLIAVTVMPLILDLVEQVPEGAAPAAGPVTALVTLGVTMVIVLRAAGVMRIWGSGDRDRGRVRRRWLLPPLLLGAGCRRTMDRAADRGLAGVRLELRTGLLGPAPGVHLRHAWSGRSRRSATRWPLQRVSWRDDRATDFRAVQGAVAADGLGNLLSGLLATVPNTTYSSSVSIVEITGVAARRVGVCVGVGFCALALLPKVVALILSIPDAIIGAYAIVLIAILFVLGMRIVVSDGMDYRKGGDRGSLLLGRVGGFRAAASSPAR